MMSPDEIIAVVQAYKDGKEIEAFNNRGPETMGWFPVTNNPVWDFSCFDYRVVRPKPPKPREWWLIKHNHLDKLSAYDVRQACFYNIHVREVL